MTELLAAGATVSTGETVAFWILGTFAVLGAFGMVLSRKAVHSALFLAVTMIALAFLYIANGAPFLGVVQIVVYTGAVMMLFLFVLMLVGVDASDSLVETIRGQRLAALVVGISFGVIVIGALGRAVVENLVGFDAQVAADGGNVQGLARLLFGRYVFAFEITAALLIVAAVGAMVLTHRTRVNPKPSQRALSEQRFATPGARATPFPAPGVYARHNAVDVPGLLPDGTPADESVPAPVRASGAERQFRTADGRTISPPAPDAPARGSLDSADEKEGEA